MIMSLPFGKYWSNLQTVSKKKLCKGFKTVVGGIHFLSEVPKIREN